MQLRNINPVGQVDLPLIGRQGEPFGEEGRGCLEAGEVFSCTADQARALLPQAANYEPADDDAKALADELAGPVEPEPEPDPDPPIPADEPATPDTTKRGKRS